MNARWQTSLHESAHVVVGQAVGIEVEGAMILPEGGGRVFWRGPVGRDDELVLVLAGWLFAARLSRGYEDDWRDVGLLRSVLRLERHDAELDDETLVRAAERAVLAIYENWALLVEVARRLHDEGIVATTDIATIATI